MHGAPQARAIERPAQLPALTGLRFIAALLVVLHHFAIYDRYGARRTPLDAILGGGSVGVNFFFVLSGFILAYTYLDGHGKLQCNKRAFWLARVARIYPVYLLAWIAAAPPFFWSHRTLDQAVVTAISSLTLTQSWLPQEWVTAWNAPSWSLSVEALFYFAFPFIAFAMRRLSTCWHLYVALVACWLAAVAAPVLCDPANLFVHGPAPAGVWAQIAWRNPVVRLPEFLLGMVLARLFVTRAAVPPRFPPAFLSVLAFALGIAALAPSGSLPDVLLHNGIMDPVCALLIYALAFNSGPLATFLGMPVIILLGEASYALYILHEPLWAWMTYGHPGLPAGHDFRAHAFALVYIGVAISISALSLQLCERPARRVLRHAFIPTARASAPN